ncbi:hypothetical protein BOTBODRAFT_57612 [Botryobasidium botryosum FD-172 SS1]|uniref:Zn(2)-C6 fungal-type domain-containing protein n=1 Tax=Botryobasidium botryosum (strain FD-172 SS1) TaxID=930990 RepID=A0A067M5K4_BOTB1|nr:hypothetical protein BOTBODRAFT_57612 [Botryobasidium botryosum FD-172 SS1]
MLISCTAQSGPRLQASRAQYRYSARTNAFRNLGFHASQIPSRPLKRRSTAPERLDALFSPYVSMQKSVALPSARARRGNACTTCRRRKIKCDSGRPVCTPCIGSGCASGCHYEIAPAKSTTKWLQRRLEELEETIARLQSPPPQHQGPKDRMRDVLPITSGSNPVQTHGVVRLHPHTHAISLEVPLPLGDPLDEWCRNGELPAPIIDRLVGIFASNRWQISFEFSVSSFEASLKAPSPDHPNVHPAFLNAVLLNACLYSRDSLRRLEPIFLSRTRHALADALGQATNLFDFLRGSALLGLYYYWTGRNIEGHHYLSGTMRFALACGLHEITSLDAGPQPGSLLPPPRDLIELGERINLFWMLFANDRAGSVMARLPVAMPDKIIKTMYPYPLVYYETRRVKNGPVQLPAVLRVDAQILEENHCTFRAKGFQYLSKAFDLTARVTSVGRTAEIMEDIIKTGLELSRLARSMPPFPERAIPPDCSDDTIFPIIVGTLALVHTSVIILHNIIADVNSSSRQECLSSARAITELLARVGVMQLPCVVPLQGVLGLSWTPAFNTLLREYKATIGTPEGEIIKADLDGLIGEMRKGTKLFPNLKASVETMVKRMVTDASP